MTQAPTVLKRSSTLPSSYWSGEPARKVLGGSDRTLGNRKRTVPRVMAAIDPVKVHQARPIQGPKRVISSPRRVGLPLAEAAGLAGAAGLGGAGGVAVTAVGGGAGAPAAGGVGGTFVEAGGGAPGSPAGGLVLGLGVGS